MTIFSLGHLRVKIFSMNFLISVNKQTKKNNALNSDSRKWLGVKVFEII